MASIQNCSRGIQDHVFTSLLASAYSLQQSQDRFRSKVPTWRSDELTRAVLDTQALVRRHAVHPETALELIASRTQKLSGAAGSAIASLDGETLEYKIACGIATVLQGCRILADASPSFDQLRNQAFTESTTWRDKALGARLVATSVLTVPITSHGKLAGCIQLFSRVGQFGEDAAYVLQLMSAIVNQVIEETELGQSVERHDKEPDDETGERAGSDARQKLMERITDSHAKSELGTSEREETGLRRDSVEHTRKVESAGKDSFLESNDNETFHTPEDLRQSKIWQRPRKLIYPLAVLLFAVFANTRGRGHAWLVLLATVLVLALTGVEIRERLLE